MSRITINMIAEQAGVSRGTVDRVLHGRPSVRPEIREKVLQTARELGYLTPGSEKPKKEKTLGVLLPGNDWYDPYLKAEWLKGVRDARSILEPLGYRVELKICESDLPSEMADVITAMQAEGLDGLALTARNSPLIREKILELTQNGIPVVTYNSDIPDSGRSCCVGQDPYRSGRVAADLIIRGLKAEDHILVMAGNLEFEGHHQRVQGFLDVCSENGIAKERISIVETYNSYRITEQKAEAALASDQDIRAIYMANESVPACAETVRRKGRKKQILIVGNDLTTATTKLLQTRDIDFIIEQNIYWQGYQPPLILKALIEDPGVKPDVTAFRGVNVVNSESVQSF